MTSAGGGRRRPREGGSPRLGDPCSGPPEPSLSLCGGFARRSTRAGAVVRARWTRPGLPAGAGRRRGVCSAVQEAPAQAKSSCSRGRAGAGRGGSVGWPRCPRILRTTMGSVSWAIRRRGPPQCGQVRTSTAKTRRRSSAQVERREWERAEVLGAVGKLGHTRRQVRRVVEDRNARAESRPQGRDHAVDRRVLREHEVHVGRSAHRRRRIRGDDRALLPQRQRLGRRAVPHAHLVAFLQQALRETGSEEPQAEYCDVLHRRSLAARGSTSRDDHVRCGTLRRRARAPCSDWRARSGPGPGCGARRASARRQGSRRACRNRARAPGHGSP